MQRKGAKGIDADWNISGLWTHCWFLYADGGLSRGLSTALLVLTTRAETDLPRGIPGGGRETVRIVHFFHQLLLQKLLPSHQLVAKKNRAKAVRK